jgi:hypothetical protein
MDNQQTLSPKILERQIQVFEGKLKGSLPGSGWTEADVRRVALHRVYDEDVEQKDLKPVTDPVLKTAMDLCRAKRKLAEPDYPKSARERHEKQKNKPLPDFLRRTENMLTPEQQESIDSFKHELTEMVDANLTYHDDSCGDTTLELSEEENTVIAKQVSGYLDKLLPTKIDHLDSEDCKDQIREDIAEYVHELIQKKIDERWEGA